MLNRMNSSGFTMIEVLTALVVFSVGLLGMATLMGTAVQGNHSAYSRTMAAFLANNMADRLRANIRGVQAGNYAIIAANTPGVPPGAGPPCDSIASACVPSQIAVRDGAEWQTMVVNLLPTATGDVVCAIPPSAPFSPTGGMCIITLAWQDSADADLNAGALSDQTYVLRIQP